VGNFKAKDLAKSKANAKDFSFMVKTKAFHEAKAFHGVLNDTSSPRSRTIASLK